MKGFYISIAMVLAGLFGAAAGSVGGGAAGFYSASPLSCDIGGPGIALVGLAGGVLGLLGGATTGVFAAFYGRPAAQDHYLGLGPLVAVIAALGADGAPFRLLGAVSANSGITHHQCAFALFMGAATGGSILMLLAVYLANRVLAKRLGHPARVLPTRFPLVSLLGVVGMAVAGGLIGYAAGFWEK